MVIAGAIFVGTLVATVTTSLTVSLWSVWPSYVASPWAMATLL